MDERKQKILRAVVHSYVRTAEPVASEQIRLLLNLGVKSATIRSEMAEMSEMGYLKQPHTSAGRIPSDLGYRFYVDRLMSLGRLPDRDARRTEAITARGHSAVDDLVEGACRLLSAITKLTALATPPTSEAVTLVWIEMREAAHDKALVLTLWSNGEMRQGVIDVPSVTSSLLGEMSRNMSEEFVGRTREWILQAAAREESHPSPADGIIVSRTRRMLEQIASDVSKPSVVMDGASNIARQPEFHDYAAMELVLSVLDEPGALAEVLEAVAVGQTPQVLIGGENPLEPLRACSLVAASYGAGTRVRGSIGICGPTRMDYRRAIAAVEVVAHGLSSALGAMLPA